MNGRCWYRYSYITKVWFKLAALFIEVWNTFKKWTEWKVCHKGAFMCTWGSGRISFQIKKLACACSVSLSDVTFQITENRTLQINSQTLWNTRFILTYSHCEIMPMHNQLQIILFCWNQLAVWLTCSVVRAWIHSHSLYRDMSLCCLSSNTTRLLPLQVTAINFSMCAASSAPTSRWRPSNRTWWRGAPGSLNTPYPSPSPTQWVQRCFVWCWIWSSSSSSVCLCSLVQSAKKRNMVKVERKPHPRSAPAAKFPAPEVMGEGSRDMWKECIMGDIGTLLSYEELK